MASKNEKEAAKLGISLQAYKAQRGGSSSSSGAPKAPKTGEFKFDSSKLVPTYQAEAASIYNPQVKQIEGLQALTKAQSEDAKVKTKDEFAQLLKREQENINRRGAFFSGGAIDQENRIGAQEGGALRDIGYQEQQANLQYQGTLSEIAQAQKDYVSSKVEGAYSSAYKTFQDKIANQMNQYQMELGQYNTDRSFNQGVIESDRNYKLAAAASARAGSNVAGSSAELKATADALSKTGGNWDQTAKMLADQGYDVSSGSIIDNELRRRNGLAPIVQKTAAEIKLEADAEIAKAKTVKEAEAVTKAMEEKLAKLNKVTGRGIGSGLTGAIERNTPSITGSKADNLNVVKSIVGKETLDTLLALKERGGTLGAVSEKELSILESSGSVIGAAAIRDEKDNIVGYNMSEKQFNEEIDRMKQSAQRLIDATKSYDVNNDPLGINI